MKTFLSLQFSTDSIYAILITLAFALSIVVLATELKERKIFKIISLSLLTISIIFGGSYVISKVNFFDAEEGIIAQISTSPATIITIIGLVILTGAIFIISKVKLDTKTIIMIAISVALAIVLDNIKLMRMYNGGSVTAGSMVPLFILAFTFGPEVGFIGGLIFGILNLILGPYILHPVQVLFDYPLPFMAIGLAGYFKNNKLLGATAAIGVRYLFHILSGVIFFASYAGDMNPILYSVIYNGTYLIPELIITLVMLKFLPIDRIIKEIKTINKTTALNNK